MSGILQCWQVIEAAGIPRPWSTTEDTERALAVWSAVLGDVDAARLQACTVAWLRSPESRYGRWPTPGALLHALPSAEAIDDADSAWAEVLELVRLLGIDRCPESVQQLEERRARLRTGYRAARDAGDTARADRYRRLGEALPREDEARTTALLAGVRACGGWRSLGRAEEEALVAHRAAFRAAYRGQRQRVALTETERAVVALVDGPQVPRLGGGR